MVRFSDKDLLLMLIKDARIPYTELARRLGVSEGAIRKRIKSLEERGVIKGYCTKVDIRGLGYTIDTIIGIDTTPDGFLRVIDRLKSFDHIVQLWTSTGDHMIMFRAWFENNDALSKFVKSLEGLDDVVKVCPAILVEQIK